MPMRPYVVLPRAAAASPLSPRQVALAYNYPLAQFDGTGATVGIVELGGAQRASDLAAFCKKNGLPVPPVEVVLVDGATEVSDPQGADVEVALDVQVVAAVAPAAKIKVFFAPNSDTGFLHAIQKAAAQSNIVSISWGGPENSWPAATLDSFNEAILAARNAGVAVVVAAGDNGSSDGTSGTVVDFPASSPNAVGCGGTRLTLTSAGARAAEVVWNDGPNSATGGGASKHFAGRDVPDVAGNADPDSGFEIVANGQWIVVGGTSAVAPLTAGLLALLFQATGRVVDLLKVAPANPTVCFDVTSGSNGAFRAGPGRDENTGFGVPDGERLLTVEGATPPAPTPPPAPMPPPAPSPTDPAYALWLETVEPTYRLWLKHPVIYRKRFAAVVAAWKVAVA